jgi:acetylornithine aminotransferase
MVSAGPNVLRLVPPLVISRQEIDLLIERLSAVFKEL